MCDICTPMGLVFNYVLFLPDSCCNLGQLESLQESFMDTLLASTLWSFSACFMPPACRAVAQMRSAQYLGCWEHPCILTSIFAKENRTWICTGCLLWKPKFFPFWYFLPVNWPNDSTIFAPSRSWDKSATTLFVGCNLSYPNTLWIPTYFPRMVAQQPWALITIVE